MKLLTSEEQQTLHHRYRHNDLYRQWAPILASLQRDYDEADAQTLWHIAEQQIGRLRDEQSFREQEISLIYNDLLSEGLKFDEIPRSKEQARRTVSTVMCIMLSMLMNAVEKGHEHECFDNEPICMAILDILSANSFFQGLMNLFFKRRTGYDGREVVITPCDPKQEKNLFENMDEVAKEEIEQMVKSIVNRTQRLKTIFKDYWTVWEPLWCDICANTQMMLMMKKKEPRGNDWGINQKMVCNVIGIFKDNTVKTSVPVNAINDVICSKNIRSYISNHADYSGTDSVFNHKQHDYINQLAKKHILSIKDN